MNLFCGDVHGKHTTFRKVVDMIDPEDEIIQVGDMGIGFIIDPSFYDDHSFGEKAHFIRGNHDNPDVCRKHPNYLGDFGYNEKLDIFFISGAYSVDKKWRISGVSWWEEEEISYAKFGDCINLFEKIKPKIVVSHDCPLGLRSLFLPYSHHEEISITNQALQSMFDVHQPDVWVFGHHHQTTKYRFKGTIFQCLGELEIRSLEDIVELE